MAGHPTLSTTRPLGHPTLMLPSLGGPERAASTHHPQRGVLGHTGCSATATNTAAQGPAGHDPKAARRVSGRKVCARDAARGLSPTSVSQWPLGGVSETGPSTLGLWGLRGLGAGGLVLLLGVQVSELLRLL